MQTPSDRQWLTVPDLAERLGTTPGRVRRLLEERVLLGARHDGVLKVPADFVAADDQPVAALQGTVVLLLDSGFAEADALRWLLAEEESLGTAPIDALRAGRKAEVRRVAQALAF